MTRTTLHCRKTPDLMQIIFRIIYIYLTAHMTHFVKGYVGVENKYLLEIFKKN